jgi:ParB family transcriptional regulator, chromosome partitioning protein
MAKRKRLTPANPAYLGAAPETKSLSPLGPATLRAPIADVASEASATAALAQMSDELTNARSSGRMVATLDLAQIEIDYLVRDRVAADDEEMQTLIASFRDRGQQTPIEVADLGGGSYGLISGWRRCQALARLNREDGGDRQVLALLRKPEEASDAYLAMVEENEIRVGLSYFERARIAAKAADMGVYDSDKAALLSLFRTASRAKRSKIRSFLPVVRQLDGVLRFPQALGERMGLQLSKRLEEDAAFGPRLQSLLQGAKAFDAQAEQAVITSALAPENESRRAKTKAERAKETFYKETEIRFGVTFRDYGKGQRVEILGENLTPELRHRLVYWLKSQT